MLFFFLALVLTTDEFLHTCDRCQVRFVSQGDLELHKVTHKVTHPHECTICDVMFTDEGYKEHNNNLSSRHPVSCPLCPERFRVRKQLQKHMKIHKVKSSHSQKIHGPKVLPCNLCTSEFSKLKELIAHQVQHKNDKNKDIPSCSPCADHFETAEEHERSEMEEHADDYKLNEGFENAEEADVSTG